MAIQGLRTTSNFVTNQRPQNWREGIMLLYPNGKTPLTALTSVMKKRVTDDVQFNWWEKSLDDRRIALSGTLAAGAATTTVPVTSGAKGCKAGDLLYAEKTGEIMLVNSDPASDTSLTVQRGFAGTSATTAITATGNGVNPNLLIIGSAFVQASLAPTGVNFDPTQKYNYTQIFRSTLEVSRTAAKTRLRTGDAVREAKRECLEYFSIDMERAFWFGQRSQTTIAGKPISTTGGVFAFIDSGNIKTVTTDYASGLTFAGLEEYMYNIFLFGSSEKVGFCGNRALLTIQQVCRKAKGVAWNIQTGIKEFGMNVTRLICPFGEIVLKTHPLWNQVRGGTTGTKAYYGLESWLAVLDMENFKYVPLTDGDVKYQPDLQDNGLDGMKSGYIAECGLEINHPTTHYLLKNLVTAAAET